MLPSPRVHCLIIVFDTIMVHCIVLHLYCVLHANNKHHQGNTSHSVFLSIITINICDFELRNISVWKRQISFKFAMKNICLCLKVSTWKVEFIYFLFIVFSFVSRFDTEKAKSGSPSDTSQSWNRNKNL